jgi:MYXO-CTERM domain-containing protein
MRTAILSVLFLGMLSAPVFAHVEMLSPMPRYPRAADNDNKACPCGVGESNRLCNVEGDRSDPDRDAARVTTLTAGGTVTVRFDEYIAHAGRYRVAIDYDGADLEDFNTNILVDIEDPIGRVGNTGGGSIWEIEVPLPNVDCDNCTLQLIQMMDGNTADPVIDPVNRSTYYTCADITITGADPNSPDAGPGVADAGVTPGSPDAGDDNPGTDSPATGSGCQTGHGTGPFGLLTLLGAFLFLRRRREA